MVTNWSGQVVKGVRAGARVVTRLSAHNLLRRHPPWRTEQSDFKLVVQLICQLFSKLNTKMVINFPFIFHITPYQDEC